MADAEIDFAGYCGEEEDGYGKREDDEFARTRFPESGRSRSKEKQKEQRKGSLNEHGNREVVPDAGWMFVTEDERGAGTVVHHIEKASQIRLRQEVARRPTGAADFGESSCLVPTTNC